MVFLNCGVRVLDLSAVGADMTSSCSLDPIELKHIMIVGSSNAFTNVLRFRLEVGINV